MTDDLSSCLPICEKFHPLNIDPFFFPRTLKFAGWAIAVNHKIEIYLEHERQEEAKRKNAIGRLL